MGPKPALNNTDTLAAPRLALSARKLLEDRAIRPVVAVAIGGEVLQRVHHFLQQPHSDFLLPV